MANEEQLEILRQGVEVWNNWRKENPKVEIDLHGVDLEGADLYVVNLRGADLSGANLSNAYLGEADLYMADLRGANLSGGRLDNAFLTEAQLFAANLRGANLNNANLRGAKFWEDAPIMDCHWREYMSGAYLSRADLSEANLTRADLENVELDGVDLTDADLTKADLRRANLRGANLHSAILTGANLTSVVLTGTNLANSVMEGTNIANSDLSKAQGLEEITHFAPSTIGTNTIQLSKGEIPEVFLRGCGLNDWEIESAKLYKLGLSNQEIIDINYKIFDLRANRAVQVSPLFISYSHGDAEFVDKLEPQFIEKGIRFWRDIHDMKAGRMEKQVDYAMRQNPTVILVLSENSIRSDWVEHEARLARDIEKEIGRDVLCPIALDDSWKSAKWPTRLMEQIKEYNILDCSKWKDNGAFGKVFNKMISGLDMFYKPDAK